MSNRSDRTVTTGQPAHGAGARREPWVFLLIFVSLYCVLYIGYSALPDELLRERLYLHLITQPAQWIINAVAPTEHVHAAANQLRSAGARFNIVRGCDGAGFYFMLVAAIVAYRQRLRRTLLGILGACTIVYLVNELRIVALYFLAAHRPDYFTSAHVYFIPTLMILVSVLYFAGWSSVPLRPHAAPAS